MEYKINVFKIKEETLMLKEKLLEDLKMSMKEKNEVRKNAVQMVRAAILQVEKDNGITLEDEKIIQIIAKEVKKRKDSLDDYIKGGREDIVKQVEEEINILSEYLPKQLSKEEIEKMVKEIIEQVGAESIKDMGKVMKEAKEKIGARADGKAINEVVKELLA
ncbi:MAG: GatB/YqeY domain-containing protein [Clostridia bacterium]|nr:GatB/YqeY domain-containing protein [Clostridia bacterium]